MALSAIPFQPMLPYMEPTRLTGSIRFDNPTDEWSPQSVARRMRNAIAYCEYQMGRARFPRFSPSRQWYLGGIRLLRDAADGLTERPKIHLALPVLNAISIPSEQLALSERPRKWLVDALIRSDARYTDAHLLAHLSRLKLAGMLLSVPQEKRRIA